MQRRLVKQGYGTGTMMISLPSKWIKENNLEKGNLINLEFSGNDLVISIKESMKKLETTIKINGFSEDIIENLIKNIYKLGYDRIIVNFSNEQQFKLLQNIIRTKLIGFEIVKKDSDSCVLENITEPSEEQFDNILSKIFLNSDELFEILERKMKSEKIAEDFYEFWELIKKYDAFCRRVVAKGKLYDIKSEMLWSFITEFVNSLKELYYVNEILSKNKNLKISKETLELLREIKELTGKTINIYKEKNIDEIGKIQEIKNNLLKKGHNMLITKRKEEDIIVHHLMSCVENLYQTSEVIYGLVL